MKKGSCIHYTGIQKDCCRAGVNYEQLVGGKVIGWAMMLPCWTSTMAHAKNFTKVACAKYTEPTDAQIEERRTEIDAVMDRMRKVMPVVNVWRKRAPKGKSEVIECPACAGRLHLVQSAYNGHVHGQCETADCVRWME
jgi:hypothetical protein